MNCEGGFIRLANRIEPEDGLRERVLALGKTDPKRRRRPVLKYAVSFVLAAAVFAGGALTLPRGFAGIGRKSAQAGFTVYVEADENGASSEVPMTPNRSFTIRQGDIYHDGIRFLGVEWADGKNNITALYKLNLKCVADGLAKVTYSTNRGSLDKKVNMTQEQGNQKDYREKAGIELPFGPVTETHEGHSVTYGYAKAGKQLTLDCGKEYDGIFAVKYSVALKDYGKDAHNGPQDGYDEFQAAKPALAEELRNTRLKITASFSDGSTCEKTVALSMGKDAWLINATLLG